MQNQNVKKNENHQLTIHQKREIFLTGVESVVAFSPTRISLILTDGTKMFVSGSDLKITAFSKEDGVFKATGSVTGISYGSKGFTAKIFK